MKKKAENIQKEVWKHFKYVPDIKQYMMEEHWTSHADEVEAGLDFSDDCDGFACTCAELLIRRGFKLEDVGIIYCTTETGEDHLVCGVDIEGITYILENRFRYIYDWKERKRYTWHYYMKFDNKGMWLKIT